MYLLVHGTSNIWKTKLLYSGIRDSRKEFVLKVGKRARLGLFDKWIDQAFTEVFGLPVRSQCFFCVKNQNVASNYGTVYSVEPLGDFRLFYSNEIHDLHDLTWIKAQIYSNKEFTEDLVAAFAIRAWTSEKCDFKDIKWQIANFLGVKKNKVLEHALTFENAGKVFVSEFYKETRDLSIIRKNAEIMVVCDSIKCTKV